MVVFPNCKINLGLHITSKRSDGYHNLETIFYPLPFFDVLEVLNAEDGATSFVSSGRQIDSAAADNLCMKAYQLLKIDFPELPLVQMHLYKNIPSGAGLGGGSADASFTLQLLNNKYHLDISQEKLEAYALQLGSDCPFFMLNKPALATGRGELLKPINLDLSSYTILLIIPGIHISTAKAFSKLTPAPPQKNLEAVVQQPIETWAAELKNDFELPVFLEYPGLQTIKEDLYNSGAVYASMSGSGSTVYGLFKNAEINLAEFPAGYSIIRLGRKA